MKTTSECIFYLSTHAWLGKSFAKLKKSDIEFVENFLNAKHSNKNEAMVVCNRLFIDSEKPKKWLIIVEMVSCAITHRYS